MSSSSEQNPPPARFLQEVPSVMDEAWAMIRDGALPHFGSVLAESQTAGRGRQGRSWSSPAGHVYAAMRLPDSPPFSGTAASMALALFLARALESLDPDLRISIKWPNDLIAFGGKVGGLLLESRGGDLLAGIGLNMGVPPMVADREKGVPPAAALPKSLGPPDKLWPLVAKICQAYYNDYFDRSYGEWEDALAASVQLRLCGLGRPIAVKNPATTPKIDSGEIRGIVRGLDASGGLKVETPQGVLIVWSGTAIFDEWAS